MVERRRREHEAERRLAGGDERREAAGAILAVEEEDRAGGRRKHGEVASIADGVAADHRRIARHQGEGLARPALPHPKGCDRLRIRRVAGELEAADPLDRNDLARTDQRHRFGDRVGRGNGSTVRRGKRQPRAAFRAGDRLGVEAAVGRIGIIAGAVRAHRERRHAGAGAVVRDGADDREARPAMGAVGEGVAVAAGRRIGDLGEAGGTGRGIGRDAGRGPAGPAFDDGEAGGRRAGESRDLDRGDAGERRRLGLEPLEEARDRSAGAEHLDQHPLAVIGDMAGELLLPCQPPDEGAEADALHRAADPDAAALARRLAGGSHQWTVQTMHGSNERTMCWTETGSASPGRTGAPTSACSSAPGVPAASRGEKFHVVGAMIW